MDVNVIIGLFGAFFIAFALVLGRSKTVLLMLATYAAYAISSESALLVSGVVEKVQENTSLATVKTVVFAVIMLFVLLKGEWGQDDKISDRGSSSTLMTLVYSVLTYGLVVSTVIGFFPDSVQSAILVESPIAAKAIEWRIWWLILPIFAMITASFFRKPTGK